MIQSFRIELLFDYPINYAYKPPGSSTSEAERRKYLGLRLSHYCDQLHRLIGRLRLRQKPIAHLEIVIKFSKTYIESSTPMEAFSAARVLLNPFRRLCMVAKPQVLSITMNDFKRREMELLSPGRVPSYLANYLKSWSKDLSSAQPSFKCDQVLDAYWRLENLLSNIKERYKAEPRFIQFEELLQAARNARENNNLENFKKFWDRVVAIWYEYLDDQRGFQFNVTRSIDAIIDTVEEGP